MDTLCNSYILIYTVGLVTDQPPGDSRKSETAGAERPGAKAGESEEAKAATGPRDEPKERGASLLTADPTVSHPAGANEIARRSAAHQRNIPRTFTQRRTPSDVKHLSRNETGRDQVNPMVTR